MNNQTLKNSIATLQSLRDAHYSQLDASALAELDEVLLQLCKLPKDPEMQKNSQGELVLRVFRIIDIILRLVSNISDWMK